MLSGMADSWAILGVSEPDHQLNNVEKLGKKIKKYLRQNGQCDGQMTRSIAFHPLHILCRGLISIEECYKVEWLIHGPYWVF